MSLSLRELTFFLKGKSWKILSKKQKIFLQVYFKNSCLFRKDYVPCRKCRRAIGRGAGSKVKTVKLRLSE